MAATATSCSGSKPNRNFRRVLTSLVVLIAAARMSRVQGVKSVPSAAAAAAPLLPRSVLLLYRHILSAHRQLPTAHRELGDAYVQAEFRRHRGAAPEFLVPFERQWRDYLREVCPCGPCAASGCLF
jgi:hypothetical protein